MYFCYFTKAGEMWGLQIMFFFLRLTKALLNNFAVGYFSAVFQVHLLFYTEVKKKCTIINMLQSDTVDDTPV